MGNDANSLTYAELLIALDAAKTEYQRAHRDYAVVNPYLLRRLSEAADRFITLQKQFDLETENQRTLL